MKSNFILPVWDGFEKNLTGILEVRDQMVKGLKDNKLEILIIPESQS